jgi:hypothetical protein
MVITPFILIQDLEQLLLIPLALLRLWLLAAAVAVHTQRTTPVITAVAALVAFTTKHKRRCIWLEILTP